MVIQRLGVMAVALALVNAGCSSSGPDIEASLGDLNDAKIAWENADISSYRVSATESRNHWSFGCTWHTVVAEGVVVESTTDLTAGGATFCVERTLTVEDLHRRIAQMANEVRQYGEPDSRQDTLDVEYNDVGVPESIEFDLASAFDEESSLRVTFTVLAQEMLAALDDESESPTEILAPDVEVALDDARSAWAKSGVDSYQLIGTETRNIWSHGCRWITVVTNGELNQASLHPLSSGQVCYHQELTVEDLHDKVQHMANSIAQYGDSSGADTLDVVFNRLGVPESIEYDLKNGFDEEQRLEVTFVVLTDTEVLALNDREDPSTVELALANAIDAWARANIGDYRMTVTDSRMQRRQGCTWVNVVGNGVVTESATDPIEALATCGPWELTVEDLHQLVQRRAAEVSRFASSDFTLEVEFNEVGVPESIEYDLVNSNNEESSMRVTFTVLP